MNLKKKNFRLMGSSYLLAFIWLVSIPIANAQVNTKKAFQFGEAAFQSKTLPAHPRLFANSQRIATIGLQKDAVTKQLLAFIKADAEKKCALKKMEYPQNVITNLFISREAEDRIISLAFAYRLFKEPRYLEKAKTEILSLAALTNWGTGHFLDVGEASMAVGIGYDWLYNELSTKERATIVAAIKNNALLPSLLEKEAANDKSWVNGNFNWNPVCHGGLMVGALAIAEQEPALAKQIVNRAVKNIPIAGEAYGPDGVFAEGTSYWSYGTIFYVMGLEALKSVLGNTTGLEKIPGFMKSADYYIQMSGPTGNKFNYSDAHHEQLNEPVLFWFANQLSRKDLVEEELTKLQESVTPNLGKLKYDTAGLKYSRFSPFELLWWKPNLLQQKERLPRSRHYTGAGLLSMGVARSAWNEENATFYAIKGGTPNNSHGHMDAGSFIVEAEGVRWALDLGSESYDLMRAAKIDLWNYAQNSTRWSTFRPGPEAHNILRFDGERQLITGNGEVKAYNQGGVMGNRANLTSLYSNKASKVERTLQLLPDNSIKILDEWTTKDNEVEVTFQWITGAAVTKTKNGLLLTQDGKTLQLVITTKVDSILIEDISKPVNKQDSPNPGKSRILIKLKTPANSNGQLNIRAIPGKALKKFKHPIAH